MAPGFERAAAFRTYRDGMSVSDVRVLLVMLAVVGEVGDVLTAWQLVGTV